ncbi:hypothetical protein X975_09855, partial [Stegodyphus mimosarum]
MIKIWNLPTTEEHAVEYFQSYGILPASEICVNGHNMVLYLKTEKQWHRNIKACAKRVSIGKGTWFKGFVPSLHRPQDSYSQ